MTDTMVHTAVTETNDGIELSPRQRQILVLLRSGASNKDIAAELNIGVGTVKQHLVVLFRKLGVTSRTAAISKSLDLHGLDLKRPQLVSSEETVRLERRPVAVLSVRVETPPPPSGADDAAIRKRLHQAFSDVGYDFGAVFFTHEGGRCDLIFGVRQARRHDALRAVRACYALHERLHRGHGSALPMRAAIACGTVVVSTDPSGAWSGEALAGAVITQAQDLVRIQPDGTVRLDGTARGMIAYLERSVGVEVPETLRLDAPPTWRSQWSPPGRLEGRVRERESLRARLYRLRGGVNGLIRLAGETGMGKTTLLHDFRSFAEMESIAISFFAAAIPDSQPTVAAAGRIECLDVDEPSFLTPAAFAQRLRTTIGREPHIVLIDDTHLLGDETATAVADIVAAYARRPVLFVAAHRGPDPFRRTNADDVDPITLGRIDRDAALSIAAARTHENAPFIPWAVDMAAGVPGFLCQICDYLETVRPDAMPDNALMPPLTLFSMIAERIEGLGLDRGVLSALTTFGTPCPKATLVSAWTGAGSAEEALERLASAGVIAVDESDRVDIRHPLVGWVAQHMTVARGAPTNEVFGR